MRTVGVVTVSRSDYGAYLPVLRKFQEDPGVKLHLIAGGMHLSPEFGLTVQAIEADGFEVSERVEILLSSDTPQGISKSMGLGLIGFAQAYARVRPDVPPDDVPSPWSTLYRTCHLSGCAADKRSLLSLIKPFLDEQVVGSP